MAVSQHLTYHVVEYSSMTEIDQLDVCVETYSHAETSPVTHLNRKHKYNSSATAGMADHR